MRQGELAGKVKNLVLSYVDSKKWSELDVIYQFSKVRIQDSYVASNVHVRYDVDGEATCGKVRKDLTAIGIENSQFPDVLGYYFATRCATHFAVMVEQRLKALEPRFRQVIFELSRYEERLPFDPKWALKGISCSVSIDEERVEKKLVEIGIVNRFYSSSNAFAHPA